MSGQNDFKLFSSAAPGVANTLTPAAYAALTSILADGFVAGIADSAQANTVWRQATMAMAVLGTIIANSGQDALDNQDVPGTAAKLLSSLGTLLPAANQAGDIKTSASPATLRAGWLLCDGSSLLRTDFPALFTAIGVSFGNVDANHFNIPDMRGMHVRGFDGTRGVDPGRPFGSYQPDQMPSHVHSVTLPPQAADSNGSGNQIAMGSTSPDNSIPPFNTASAGVGSETRVKTLAMNFFICTGQ